MDSIPTKNFVTDNAALFVKNYLSILTHDVHGSFQRTPNAEAVCSNKEDIVKKAREIILSPIKDS